MIRFLALLWPFLALLVAPAFAQTRTSFGVEGGDFRAELPADRILCGANLAGDSINLTGAGTSFALRWGGPLQPLGRTAWIGPAGRASGSGQRVGPAGRTAGMQRHTAL